MSRSEYQKLIFKHWFVSEEQQILEFYFIQCLEKGEQPVA